MTTSIHIVYPQSGIKFSQLRKIFATFEEGCKLYGDADSAMDEGKVIKVESGSIWLEVVFPIVQNVFPLFAKFIFKKLSNKRSKDKFHIEIDLNCKITITIDE